MQGARSAGVERSMTARYDVESVKTSIENYAHSNKIEMLQFQNMVKIFLSHLRQRIKRSIEELVLYNGNESNI
jgi:uncharacterized protein YajQ (UPF0234 family)